MEVAAKTEPRPGQPRSERDAAFLKRYDARMVLPIVVSAILPLLIVPQSNGWVGATIGVVTWLVFLADYVVHDRHLEHYGRTRLGRSDLFVVIATAPWFLFAGAQAGLSAEVSALRHQVEALTARLTGTPPSLAPQEPSADQDGPG